MLKGLLLWMLIAGTPAWLAAADAGAMLYSKGVVLRNGEAIPDSSAIFPGDLLETKAGSVATVNSPGSSIVILPGSLVEFQGESMTVDHGSVRVATSHGIVVRVGCMMVVPLSAAWTRFEVNDVDGTVQVAARQNDVKLEGFSRSEPAKEVSSPRTDNILHEGEQATRDESAGCKGGDQKEKIGAAPAGYGGILGSKAVIDSAIAAIAGLGVWLALDNDAPPSPWKP